MGDFRMTIEAQGGHGCDRQAKEGEQLMSSCGREGCPDCMFARFVSEMQRAGMRPYRATFQHWPADMAAHRVAAGHEFTEGAHCCRCGAAWGPETEPGSPQYRPCRNYDVEREVVDSYTEEDVKYPTGAFLHASGVRVEGHF